MPNNQSISKENSKTKKSALREYIEAILTAVLIALFIRSFGIEAFKIPSSSMIPTLMIGDHIFVNKFIYGLRIPFTKIRFFDLKKPERGDIVVFIYPEEEDKDFIKRVVGLPGDVIKLEDEHLYINGDEVEMEKLTAEQEGVRASLTLAGSSSYKDIPFFNDWAGYDFYEETIDGKSFIVQYQEGAYRKNAVYNVPDGNLFVMGDNRDNSSDSREWGFVPLKNVKGKAMFVWLPLDKENGGIRFSRIGRWIK